MKRTLLFWGLSQVLEVRWTFFLISKYLTWKLFCSPPNYHFSKASASGRRLISWLFLKDGFEIKGPPHVIERELNCGNFLFGGIKIEIHLGSVTMNKVCSVFRFLQKIKAPAKIQIFNLRCVLLALSLKDYNLKFFCLFLIGYTQWRRVLSKTICRALWDTLNWKMKVKIQGSCRYVYLIISSFKFFLIDLNNSTNK